MKKLFILFVCLVASCTLHAQFYRQYFDGADTTSASAKVKIQPLTDNIWQVGKPQKVFFNSAATLPNAIITDTIHNYPAANTSSFVISVRPYVAGPFINAYQWVEKLDMTKKHSGGIIEFSVDSGATWVNVFNNPSIYSFYGFDSSSKDTLLTGEYALSGTDTSWRDIWLCFPPYFAVTTDSLLLRFTFKSDSADTGFHHEGWMIDNFIIHPTFVHTASKILKETDQLNIYPNYTTGILQIGTKRAKKLTGIQKMEMLNSDGKLLRQWGESDFNTQIDISDLPAGNYLLNIKTNLGTEIFKVVKK